MASFKFEEPNERQREFMYATTRFVAYGGARGGGKSWAVRRKAELLALNYAGIRILIIRRSFAQLRENHIVPMKKELHGFAVYRESTKTFDFPNESAIVFGYCDTEADTQQYLGREYDVIFRDEATQLTYMQFIELTAILRGANNFPKRMYLTCNPGGVGHAWVKRLFIDRKYEGTEKSEDYLFIPAKVGDNYALQEKDPGYVQMLQNLPEDLRKAWLDGDWDVFAGQYFTEWNRDRHVCDPFNVPKHWRRYLAIDYGLDMLAALWIAVDEHGEAYVYRELYQSGLVVSDAAAAIIRAQNGDKPDILVAPPDLWARRQDTGRSVVELFGTFGLYFVKASAERVAGWMNVKEWLKVRTCEDGNDRPQLKIFRTCPNLIRCIPLLQYDEHNTNDCSTEPHEITHAPDALRYWASGRPSRASAPLTEEEKEKLSTGYDAQVQDFLNFGVT